MSLSPCIQDDRKWLEEKCDFEMCPYPSFRIGKINSSQLRKRNYGDSKQSLEIHLKILRGMFVAEPVWACDLRHAIDLESASVF